MRLCVCAGACKQWSFLLRMDTVKRLKTFILGDDFFTGNLYLFALAVATLLAWYFENMIIAFAVYGVAIIAMAVFSKSLIGVMPILCFATMSCGISTDWDMEVMKPIIVAGVILIAALVAAVIIYFVRTKSKIRPRVPLLGFVAVAVAALFGGLGISYFKTAALMWLGGIGVAVGMLVAAWLVSAAVKENNPVYLARVFVYMAMIVVAETVLYYLRLSDEELSWAILQKTLTYGWGVSNAGAVVILMGIPACFYLMTVKENRPYLSMIGVVVFVVAIFFTQSRTAELVALAVTPVCFVIAFAATDKKVEFIEATVVAAVAAGVVYIGFRTEIKDVIERWMNKGFGSSGRIELWTAAWDEIKSGAYVTGHGFLNMTGKVTLHMVHNQILQFWYNFGAMGLVAAALYYFFIYKTLFYKTGVGGLLIGIVVLASDMFGFMDVTLFTPYCMMPMICAMVMAKNLREAREDEKFRALALKAREAELAASTPSAVLAKTASDSFDDIDDGGIPKINLF